MALPLHPDGCIVANIPVKHFAVYFAPRCEHTKMRGAYAIIDAPSEEDAFMYASRWIRMPGLSPRDVTEVSGEPPFIVANEILQ